MKKFFKFVGIVTSISAVIAGAFFAFKKFCGKKCVDCDDEEFEDLELVDVTEEDDVEEPKGSFEEDEEPETVEEPAEGE